MPKSLFSGGATGLGVAILNAVAEVIDAMTGGAARRDVTATAAGDGTALLTATDVNVNLISANSGHFVTIGSSAAAAGAAKVGRKIKFQTGATACKLRCGSGGGTINNVDCTTAAAQLVASQTYELELTAANTWRLIGWTNLGAVATAIVPA